MLYSYHKWSAGNLWNHVLLVHCWRDHGTPVGEGRDSSAQQLRLVLGQGEGGMRKGQRCDGGRRDGTQCRQLMLYVITSKSSQQRPPPYYFDF